MSKNSINLNSLLLGTLESSPFGILAIDLDGTLIFLNQMAANYLRKPISETLNQSIYSIVPHFEFDVSLLTSPESIEKIQINDQIFIANHAPLWINEECKGVIIVLKEIEAFENIIRNLSLDLQIKHQLTSIFENSQDGLFLTDGKGVIIQVNSAYEKVTGFKREELVGVHMSTLVEKKMISKSTTLQVLAEKKPVTELQTLKNGKQIMVTSTPVFDEAEKIILVVSNVRDITYLKTIEEELEKVKGLTEKYSEDIAYSRPSDAESLLLESPRMKQMIEHIHQIAPFPTSILLHGESGVGKEVIASLIHQYSPRNKNPFIKVNCSAIPESLFESELYGYEKGAFSGANKEGKPGLLELANGGTILLDEIGELPLSFQVKLLRTIQERELRRVGGTKIIPLDIRIISATNKDLKDLVSKKLFREDLFYRLNVVDIHIPPLRERRENIKPLVLYYLKHFSKNYHIKKEISKDALAYLELYSWPGNIRELRNLIENLTVSSASHTIFPEHLPNYMKEQQITSFSAQNEVNENIPHLGLRETISRTEKAIILQSLRNHKSIRQAASYLKIDHSTLVRKMSKLGIRSNNYIAE